MLYPRFHASLITALAAFALWAPPLCAQERETTSILEEQELLRRQLQRLKRTMEALIPRLEQEGRPRALELLREGLGLLETRSDGSGQLTVEELMDKARQDVQAGQVASSIERQEQIIQHLERLLAVLLDRQNVENLEKSLADLAEIQKGLQGLRKEEQDLQKETEKLREESASEAQKSLEQEIDRLRAEQRALLEKNEAAGRQSGAHALEEIERELAQLAQRQRVDREVLQSWNPEASKRFEGLERALDEARRAAERAERLSQVASELREAASKSRENTSDAGASRLDKAAEREERRARASGDEAAKAGAEALQRAAEAMRKAGADPAQREEAAKSAEAAAAELEQQAAAQREAAGKARKDANAQAKSAKAGGAAPTPGEEALNEALEQAAQSGTSAEKAEEAARATQAAAEAARKEREDQQRLGPALSASQNDAAQTAERLSRSLEGLPEPKPGGESEARQALEQAAEAMKQAATEARSRSAEEAAKNAEAAEKALEKAQAALQGAREQRASSDAPSQAAQQALAGEQQQLSEQAKSAQSKTSTGSMAPQSESQVKQGLEQAREAMQRASEELKSGRSASAAESQRDALEALDRAKQAAEEGVRPSSPEDRQRAEELADQQEAVRKKLLDLATRNKERKNARPLPSLDKASSKASEASESLDEGDLAQAGEEEQEVEQEIDKALDELKDEEEQYQRLRQEELLFKIAEEVAALLKVENDSLGQVREIDSSRAQEEKLSRADRLRLRRVAGELVQAASRTTEVASAIEEEQALIFAHVLREVRQDLERVARDIDETGGNATSERVQALLEDSIETTQWVLDALKDEQRRREDEQKKQQEQQQQQQQGQQKQPLVPDVAELKLLRQLEVDTLGQLDRLMLVYPDLDSPELEPAIQEDVLRLAERHERTSRLFAQFRARLGIPGPEEKQP